MGSEISIIIPVYKEEKLILKAISRLRNSGAQIIVVDGDPDASSISQISDPSIRKVLSTKGRAQQMNAGAKLATGKILLFLHVDTVLPPYALEQIRQVMKRKELVAGAFSLQLDSNHWWLKTVSKLTTWRSQFTRVPYGDQALFVRKNVFTHLRGYQEIPIMEDLDLMLRLRKQKGKIIILKAAVISSARKWQQYGLFFTSLVHRILATLKCLGCDYEQLYRIRRKLLQWKQKMSS